MHLARALLTAALALPLAACGDDAPATGPAGEERLSVAAAFYPLELLAQRVGGDAVEVKGLARGGAEPHDLELTPQQVAEVSEADLVVYLQGFQPAVDDAVEQQAADRALDVAGVAPLEQGFVPLEGGELHEDEKGADPHVWLDPERYAALGTAVGERLAEVDPDGAAGYRERAAALRAELLALDAEMAKGLTGCARKDLVTSHNAFGYLARAYGLQQVAITGLTPEDEPTPRRLAEVTRLARERGVTTVFFEELVSPKVAQALAREIGAKAEVLDPLETAPETGDYLSAMRTNLATLRTALGCP
jgi:zinc transport system substrate-binding protein